MERKSLYLVRASRQEYLLHLLLYFVYIGSNSVTGQLNSNLYNGTTAYCGQEVTLNCTFPVTAHDWRIEPIGIETTLNARSGTETRGPFTFTVPEIVRDEDRIISSLSFTAFPDLQTNITNITCFDGTTFNPSPDQVQTTLPIFEGITTPSVSVTVSINGTKVLILWQDDINDSMVSTVLVGESATEGECSPSTEVTAEDRANHNYTFTSLSDDTLDQYNTFCVRFENGEQCVSNNVTIQPFKNESIADNTTMTVTPMPNPTSMPRNISDIDEFPVIPVAVGASVGSILIVVFQVILISSCVMLKVKRKGTPDYKKNKSKNSISDSSKSTSVSLHTTVTVDSNKKFAENKLDENQKPLDSTPLSQKRTLSESKPPTQPSLVTKATPSPSSQQQSSGPGLIYADLEISHKRPGKQKNQHQPKNLEVGLDPGEVQYAALQSQETAP